MLSPFAFFSCIGPSPPLVCYKAPGLSIFLMCAFSADISINGQKLEEVTSFTYLGATLCKGGTCSAEVCIRIASAMSTMARLNRIWQCNTISFASNFELYKSLVTFILLYGRQTWTLLADSEKRIQAFATKCLLKLLRIFYLQHKINDWVQSKDQLSCGSTGTSSSNCPKKETCVVRACHTP